ncbi:UbiA family prenyltransferase [candidate division WOR-3 bacterium]|nr:UbiA family prenyltransferase [candidate division WOR-3 bacterium]
MDYFMLLRPTLFLPLWIFFLLGAHHAEGEISLGAVGAFILYTMLMGGVYIFNQIIDRESDKKNKKLFLLSDGLIPLKNAYIEMTTLFLIAVSASFILGINIFIAFLVSLFLGITYSLPPIETKGKPFLDILWNSCGYGVLAFMVGWLAVVSEPSKSMFITAIPYFFAVAAVFVNTTIPDIEGDRREGKVTTGVFLGKKNTLLLGVILDFVAIVVSYLMGERGYICLIGAGLAFPIFLIAYIKQTKKTILFSFRAIPGILAIIVFFISPIIIPLFAAVLGVQKVYYKRKFNIDYPSMFSGKERDF